MRCQRRWHGIAKIKNTVYAVFGNLDNNIEKYDIRNNHWDLIRADLPEDPYFKGDACAASINSLIFITCYSSGSIVTFDTNT